MNILFSATSLAMPHQSLHYKPALAAEGCFLLSCITIYETRYRPRFFELRGISTKLQFKRISIEGQFRGAELASLS